MREHPILELTVNTAITSIINRGYLRLTSFPSFSLKNEFGSNNRVFKFRLSISLTPLQILFN